MKFTNENVLKENKKMNREIIIGLIVIVISLIFLYLALNPKKPNKENFKHMDDIITDETIEYKDYLDSYINIIPNPYKFAVYDDTTDSYYMVSDGNYLYIVYMTEDDYQRISKLYDENNPNVTTRIEGKTKLTTKDVKELAIEVYNESFENEEEKITLADFENYFGGVYLDMTSLDTDGVNDTYMLLFFLTISFGVIFTIIFIIRKVSFVKGMKKIEEYDISKLDKEMNDEKAFYYDKAKTYLTENYIISFGIPFSVIKYSDILWMYRFEQRTNGIKTNQSIRVLTNDGKNRSIVSMDMITKKQKEIYTEIWNIITSKNTDMLLGYTKENIDKMNAKKKEIKQNKIK